MAKRVSSRDSHNHRIVFKGNLDIPDVPDRPAPTGLLSRCTDHLSRAHPSESGTPVLIWNCLWAFVTLFAVAALSYLLLNETYSPKAIAYIVVFGCLSALSITLVVCIGIFDRPKILRKKLQLKSA